MLVDSLLLARPPGVFVWFIAGAFFARPWWGRWSGDFSGFTLI